MSTDDIMQESGDVYPKVIVYKHDNGLVRKVVYLPSELQAIVDLNTDYIIVDILPRHFDIRSSLFKLQDGQLVYDIIKCKEAQKNKWRYVRESFFPILDLEIIKSAEQPSASKYTVGQITSWKQQLRNITINNIPSDDPEYILQYYPDIIKLLQIEFKVTLP